MRITFKNSYGIEKEIGKIKVFEEVFHYIQKYLDKNNYKSNYIRYVEFEPGKFVFDVGSHTEFFYLYLD
jgi:hypothetical protein